MAKPAQAASAADTAPAQAASAAEQVTDAGVAAAASTADEGLVSMFKDGQEMFIHPTCVDAHKAAGWIVKAV